METPEILRTELLGTKNRVWCFSWHGQALLQIKLTKGLYTVVDDTVKNRHVLTEWRYYARDFRPVGYRSPHESSYLYNDVSTLTPTAGYSIDHYNQNPLDNRQCNLRLLTSKQQNLNQAMNVNNSSGHRGICKLRYDAWKYGWKGADGKQKNKYFSWKDKSKQQALEEAVAFRDERERSDPDYIIVKKAPDGYEPLPDYLYGETYAYQKELAKVNQRVRSKRFHDKTDERISKRQRILV